MTLPLHILGWKQYNNTSWSIWNKQSFKISSEEIIYNGKIVTYCCNLCNIMAIHLLSWCYFFIWLNEFVLGLEYFNNSEQWIITSACIAYAWLRYNVKQEYNTPVTDGHNFLRFFVYLAGSCLVAHLSLQRNWDCRPRLRLRHVCKEQ